MKGFCILLHEIRPGLRLFPEKVLRICLKELRRFIYGTYSLNNF